MGVSVVRTDRRRRWAVVAAAAAVLVSAPAVVEGVRQLAVADDAGPVPAARVLTERVRSSGSVPHAGLVESRGGIALPDLPRLGRVSALAGGTTRARVWWHAQDRWRVDTLTTTGERGSYRTGDRLVTWDYEDDVVIVEAASDGVRLPRAADLPPGEVARRLLGGLGPADRVERRAGTTVVAGRPAWTLDVVPGDPRGTLTGLEIDLDTSTGLPLAVTVRGPGGTVALVTRYVTVDVTVPPPAVLDPPSPPGAAVRRQPRPDLVEEIDRTGPWRLPDRLAGMPRTTSLAGGEGGAATYGEGLARFVVLPLPVRLSGRVADGLRGGGAATTQVPGGRLAELGSGPLGVVVAAGSDGDHVYLLSGTVRGEVLRAAGSALLARPPARRG